MIAQLSPTMWTWSGLQESSAIAYGVICVHVYLGEKKEWHYGDEKGYRGPDYWIHSNKRTNPLFRVTTYKQGYRSLATIW